MLVLLDISLSMNAGLDGNTCIEIPGFITCPPSKMKIATQAMSQMTVTYATEILWGLALFPGNGDCGAPVNMIAPAAGNASNVSSRVSMTLPAGFTPINAAIGAVQASGYLEDPDRKNFLLLISDGGETCMGDNADTAQRIADMHAAGISTFVVGFGGGIDPTVLNDFAQKGGVPNTGGSTSFFQADSAAALETALGAIFQRVAGCDFALAGPPDDPDAVWSFLDDVMIERDGADGWFLDTAANQVSFVGASCDRLQAGDVRDIDIVFGCPEPVLE
jgi:hypothetical protein